MGTKKPTAIDLFAGCGGLTLGLKQAGFRVVGAVEIDGLAVETYKKNHPGVRVWQSDISKLHAKNVREVLKLEPGELDLLAGCPPCQGFSTIPTLNGKRRSRDPRNELIFDFLRFVRAFRPRAVMLENVPRMSTNKKLRRFKSNLNRLGYKANTGVLDAAKFGVPQRRRRFILLASKGTAPSFADQAGYSLSVRAAIGKLPKRVARDRLHCLGEARSAKVKALIRRIPKNGGSRASLGKRAQLPCHKDLRGFHDIYGRMAWDDVAPTITSGCVNPSKGRFLHPEKNRCITLREAALLQSFPATYWFSLKRGKFSAAEMIGNALPPEFIRRHAEMVKRALRQKAMGGSTADVQGRR